jgi:hypothetical protein
MASRMHPLLTCDHSNSDPKAAIESEKMCEEIVMKSSRLLAIAAFLLAAVCSTATPASAQAVVKGSFTLTHEVCWQNATLPAGNYTFEMKSLAAPSTIIVKGPNGYQFVTANVADENAGEQSMLIVENRGGGSAISELRLAAIGRSLRYSVPKAPKEVKLAQRQVTREQILVALKAK